MAASTWSSQELVSRIFDEICPPQMLSDISVRMVDQFIGERRKKVRPATVNRDLRTLKAAFNQARKRGYLESNPFAEVKQLKVPQKEIRVLSPDEIQRLLGACPNLQWPLFGIPGPGDWHTGGESSATCAGATWSWKEAW